MATMQTVKMTTDDWVKFYLENPEQLKAFIEISNEQANRMAHKLNAIEQILREDEDEQPASRTG